LQFGLSLSNSPVGQGQHVTKLLNSLEMRGVGGDQLQVVMQGGGSDHRVGGAYRLADAFQVAGDAACQLGSGLIEGDYFLRGDQDSKINFPPNLFPPMAVGVGNDLVHQIGVITHAP
jgi:hypothetical protein